MSLNSEMKRPKQHQIDELAQRTFEAALPTVWVTREQKPDYAIDYLVEIGKSDELTGVSFAVQLKGQKSLASDGEFVLYHALKTRHLVYYLDKQRAPVFLVLVNVAKGEGYWLFLQQYALEHLKNVDWRRRATVTIRMPVANSLKNIRGLECAVHEADRFMTELRPGAVRGAIVAERKRLESLDPRIRVEVTATEGRSHFQFNPVEPVEFSLTFKGATDKVSRMVEDLVDRGLPVDVRPGDIEVRGSALFEDGMNNKAFTIQCSKKQEGLVRLSTVDADENETAAIDPFPAKLEGGARECRLSAQLRNTPLSVSLKFDLPKEDIRELPGVGKCDFSVNQWAGQRILHLAYFDQIYRMVLAQRSGCDLKIRLTVDGNELFSVRGDSSQVGLPAEIVYALEALQKAREIARWLSRDPILPRDLNLDDVAALHDLHWRLSPGDRTRPASGTRLGIEIGRDAVAGYLASPKNINDEGITISHQDEKMSFLTEEVGTGPVVYEFTRAKLEQSEDLLRTELGQSPAKHNIRMTWIGGAQSEFIVHRPPRDKA